MYRPILAGKVTLQELETHYTVADLYDLLEAMDIQQAFEQEAEKANQAKQK